MKIKVGMGRIMIEEFAALMDGVVSAPFDTEETCFTHICTDSREADADSLFVAIKGERADGHDYMLSAAERGCVCFLCQRIPDELLASGFPFAAVTCENSVTALGEFVRAYMEFRSRKTVAVTGSVGKTTTKECIAAVLSAGLRVHKTGGNHNSTLGMPMSFMEMTEQDEVLIAEMGMSAMGEISFMSRIALPDIACITNVGSSHMELLGSKENILRAKLEIIDGMREGGTLIVNGDDPLLKNVSREGLSLLRVAIDNVDADYRADNIRYEENASVFDLVMGREKAYDLRIPMLGRQYVMAALFAVASGLTLGLDMETVRRGLSHFENEAMRQNIICHKGITVIEDCYNASPESMKAAIDLMRILSARQGGARLVAVLGDMYELGEQSEALHVAVGRYYAMRGAGLLFTLGERALAIAEGAIASGLQESSVTVCTELSAYRELGDKVVSALKSGDILLVKASRAVGAEQLLAYVLEKI